MTTMRAKMEVTNLIEHVGLDDAGDAVKTSEQLHLRAVCPGAFPPDGSDEDNTFARFTPTAELMIMIANPALFGAFTFGDKLYVDFSRAD